MKANEPAFPVNASIPMHEGLTKREYFAGIALQGILAHHGLPATWDKETLAQNIDSPVTASLIIADELLKQLEGH